MAHSKAMSLDDSQPIKEGDETVGEGVIIAVDLGGTQTRAARLDQQLRIVERDSRPTVTTSAQTVVDGVIASVRAVWPQDGTPVLGVGLGSPGPLDPFSGVILSPPNLPMRGFPLGDVLKEALGVPVTIGNDANAAALGEYVRGAGRGTRNMIYLTVSTGVGGGFIVDGKLLAGARGLGGEPGILLMAVEPEDVRMFETLVSGPHITRMAREAIAAGAESSLKNLTDFNTKDVGDAARAGDALALSVINRAAALLGVGIVNLLHLFDPERIVIGGGVTKLGSLLFDPMWAAIRHHVSTPAYLEGFQIVPAELGGDAGLIGAGILALADGGRGDVSAFVD